MGSSREAEARRHRHRRTVAGAGQPRTAIDAKVGGGRTANLLVRKHAGHAELLLRIAREAVVLAQLRAQLAGQRVLRGARQIVDANARRVGAAARTAGGDNRNLLTATLGNQRRLRLHLIDAVEHEVAAR